MLFCGVSKALSSSADVGKNNQRSMPAFSHGKKTKAKLSSMVGAAGITFCLVHVADTWAETAPWWHPIETTMLEGTDSCTLGCIYLSQKAKDVKNSGW